MRGVTAEVRQSVRSDARDNRRRILAAARKAFAVEGPGVPMREIARAAEVGVATVYRHFPSKEELLAEAFADELMLCSEIVGLGLAQEDPWEGFSLVIGRLIESHAVTGGFTAGYLAQPPRTGVFTADRERALRRMARLIDRAKRSGKLRQDFVLEDVVLALMANGGIRASSPAVRLAASKRFAALMLRSFRAEPGAGPGAAPEPLPPAVRLPLAVQ